jgi:hypothetical protein
LHFTIQLTFLPYFPYHVTITYFSYICFMSFHYSTCLSSIFSISFHYSTYLSSIYYNKKKQLNFTFRSGGRNVFFSFFFGQNVQVINLMHINIIKNAANTHFAKFKINFKIYFSY